MKAPLVVYHKNCFDGFTAAWVFRNLKGQDRMFQGHEVEYFPALHGDIENLPDTRGRHVWFLDFTYPREIMMDLIVASKFATVYDHHKSALEALESVIFDIREERGVLRTNDKIVFDMKRSGAGITFDELERERGLKHGGIKPRFNGQRSVWLVDYVEDRDIWKHELPDTKEVSAYLATVPMTFENWDDVEKMGFEDVAQSGSSILKYINQYGDIAIDTAKVEQMGPYRVPTINIPVPNNSDHINLLARLNPDAEFAAGYFRSSDGKWHFSLRSIGDFDVSAVAKMYGGGGHKNASGFEVDKLPWDKSVPVYEVSTKEEIDELANNGSLSKPEGIVRIVDPS